MFPGRFTPSLAEDPLSLEDSSNSSELGSSAAAPLVRCRVVQRIQARRPERTGERASSRFDVAKKTGLPALFPIWRFVGIDSRARTQQAEKGMLGRIDHNPGVSVPDGQVARLRICHPAKFVDPRIEVRRGRVFVRETRALIESVNEVRAIGSEACMMA